MPSWNGSFTLLMIIGYHPKQFTIKLWSKLSLMSTKWPPTVNSSHLSMSPLTSSWTKPNTSTNQKITLLFSFFTFHWSQLTISYLFTNSSNFPCTLTLQQMFQSLQTWVKTIWLPWVIQNPTRCSPLWICKTALKWVNLLYQNLYQVHMPGKCQHHSEKLQIHHGGW